MGALFHGWDRKIVAAWYWTIKISFWKIKHAALNVTNMSKGRRKARPFNRQDAHVSSGSEITASINIPSSLIQISKSLTSKHKERDRRVLIDQTNNTKKNDEEREKRFSSFTLVFKFYASIFLSSDSGQH